MTTIAITKDMIAADGQLTGHWVLKQDTQKVYKVGSTYYCFSGKAWKWQRFLEWLQNKGSTELLPDMDNIEVLEITRDRKCYSYEGSGVCTPCKVEESLPNAIGSGAKYAIGAMLGGATAEKAVLIASQVDPYTNDNVKVYKL